MTDAERQDVASTFLAEAQKLVGCAIREGGWQRCDIRELGGRTEPVGPDSSKAGSGRLIDSRLKSGNKRGKHGW